MKNVNTCIVLAGGLGTRLRAAIPDKPKCLAPIGNKSFLQIQIELLASQGISRFVLSLGYLANKVLEEVSLLKEKYDIRTVIESRPLGTGGAVLMAMEQLKIQEAVVTNGDTFLDGSIDQILTPLDKDNNELARIAVTCVSNRARYGGISLNGDRVVSFLEKGVSEAGVVNAGLYRLSREAFHGFPLDTVYSLENDIFPQLILRSAITASVIDGEFTDIGLPEDYYRFCSLHA